MEQQQQQQLEQQLRQNWQQIRYRILDDFAQVSLADVEAAKTVNDLVQRIADKSHHSERYVETRLVDLVGATTGGGGMQQQGTPFGQQQQQPTGQQQTGQQQPGQRLGGQQ